MTIEQERAPDAIEPITAYRFWSAARDGTLYSLNGETWPPGFWLNARCAQMGHAAPLEGCSCGVYAAKELDLLLPMTAIMLPRGWSTSPRESAVAGALGLDDGAAPILGKVHLAGKVIEHDLGYRAERACIAEILPLPGYDAWTEAVSRRYDVPVGDPIAEETIDALVAFDRLLPLGCGTVCGRLQVESHDRLSPWPSLWCVVWSLFFLVNAVRGILMDGGPHWSEWWLWPIALASGLVALPSFLILCIVIAEYCLGELEAPAGLLDRWSRDGRSLDGPPRPIPDRPRPY